LETPSLQADLPLQRCLKSTRTSITSLSN